MPKISVIIPVYNVERYLKECLDSIINQTLKDIEIICINDGSTDNSLEILREYEKKDKRIKVIDKNNAGAGEARNEGISVAKGDYLMFFDSDDYMADNCLSILYNKAIKEHSDITLCYSYRFNDTDKQTMFPISYAINKDLLENKTVFSPIDISKYIFQFCVGWPWDKLYKREFIINNELKFQNLRHSNDTYFVLMSLVFANVISYTDEYLVYHRNHNMSLANTRKKAPECFYYALEAMYKTLLQKDLYKTYEQSFVNYCITFPRWHIDTTSHRATKNVMIKMHKKILKEIKLQQHSKEYFYDASAYKKTLKQYATIKILANLFSIKNEHTINKKYKVITILGLKIKFRVANNNIYQFYGNKKIKVKSVKGIKIKFLGDNNKIEIGSKSTFNNCNITLGSNNQIHIGENCYIKNEEILVTSKNCKVHIGDQTGLYGGMLSLRDKPNTSIHIGNNCLFSSNVALRTSDGHAIFDVKTKKLLNMDGDIFIGDHVWVGANVTILKNVNICNNVINGNGSIVTKKLHEEECIYAGVPARQIKSGVSWNIISPDKY